MSARNDAELDALMTAEEVARLLGVNVAWVYAQSRRRRIPTVTLGRYRRTVARRSSVGSRRSKTTPRRSSGRAPEGQDDDPVTGRSDDGTRMSDTVDDFLVTLARADERRRVSGDTHLIELMRADLAVLTPATFLGRLPR